VDTDIQIKICVFVAGKIVRTARKTISKLLEGHPTKSYFKVVKRTRPVDKVELLKQTICGKF